MSHPSSRAGLLVVFLLSPMTVLGQEEARYEDDRFHFSLEVTAPWTEAPLAGYAVPGTARAAWSGPESASIVAFVQEPGRAFTARFLVDVSVEAMKQAIGAKVTEQEVKPIDGKPSMSMIISAQGNGAALGGGGDIETVQHWIAVPREKDVVVVLLTTPESQYETLKPIFQKVVESMKVGGEQTAEQKASK